MIIIICFENVAFRAKLGSDFWQGKQQTFGDTEVESTIIVEKSALG